LEYEFVDIKKNSVPCETIEKWLKKVDINVIFNKRGTKYRQLKLKDLKLDETGMKEWLCKEPMLMKRPILEHESGDVIVGFDEEKYKIRFKP